MINDERWPFFTVDLELTSHCGQNCLFCPRERITRAMGFMETGLLRNIVKQLAEIGSRLTFCGMGNPLLHPEFDVAGQICRQAKIKYGLTIQAPALDEDGINKITAFAPHFIEVSLPAIDEALFSRLYPGQKLAVSLHNLQKLVEQRGSSRGITVVCVQTGAEQSTPEQISSFWRDHGLNCRIMPCHSRGSGLQQPELIIARPTKIDSCGLFATHAFITWQGRLLSCCHDLSGHTEIADLNFVALKDAGRKKIDILAGPMPWRMCHACDEPAARRAVPDRPFPESEKARGRFLKQLVVIDKPE